MKIVKGVNLEDGIAYVETATYIKNTPKKVGIEIHKGKNSTVREFSNILDTMYFVWIEFTLRDSLKKISKEGVIVFFQSKKLQC